MSYSPSPVRNVIIFGSTGCGKSSIVNMLLGRNEAEISNGAKGCTFDHHAYTAILDGNTYQLYDTNGLDEGNMGSTGAKEALVGLYHLLRDLQDGVTLLVYCMRGPRVTESLQRNYDVFYDGFCRKSVPIVMVVTGLENQLPNMETWWNESDNRKTFAAYNMQFHGHACITATPGKMGKNGTCRNQVEYDESCKKLRKLVAESCKDVSPWSLQTSSWFVSIMKWFHRNLPAWIDDHFDPRLGGLYDALRPYISEKEAKEIARRADAASSRQELQQITRRADSDAASSYARPEVADTRRLIGKPE
ncbi:hypothetical protein D9757_010950 [Collybiopsis confluens]|uniref:G domain-containing protein n=1 Tax=Collybiopsis confluens TaxID=2823264 RepID=A0A8H5GJ92_9AGAR|nr:hypothetical protein D9757_010950 [Collybiopsis confluens]